jgi:hypothetical protein
MKAKFAIVAVLGLGVVVLGYAYVRGYPPFTSQFVQTCEKAIEDRLMVPSTYQRIAAEEHRRTIAFEEFFTGRTRAVSEATRKAMVQTVKVPPVQYTALIDYRAQDAIGAIIRERATCTFNSLDGTDAPTRQYQVMVDGEHNFDWAARLPRSDTRLRHLLGN